MKISSSHFFSCLTQNQSARDSVPHRVEKYRVTSFRIILINKRCALYITNMDKKKKRLSNLHCLELFTVPTIWSNWINCTDRKLFIYDDDWKIKFA